LSEESRQLVEPSSRCGLNRLRSTELWSACSSLLLLVSKLSLESKLLLLLGSSWTLLYRARSSLSLLLHRARSSLSLLLLVEELCLDLLQGLERLCSLL